MSIAASVKTHLIQTGVNYDTVVHSPTSDAAHAAEAAHVRGDRLAKAIVLEDDSGYLVAVIPASHKLDLDAMSRELSRNLTLTPESKLTELFEDCAPGAVPAVGQAYGLETIVDQELMDNPAVYFEAGDHSSLIRVSGPDFNKLMANAPQRHISHHL